MPYSMTGYGKSKQNFKDYEIESEIRSLNNRFLDITIRLPKSIEIYDQKFKDEIKKRIRRGKLSLNISINKVNSEENGSFSLNDQAINHYFELVKNIRKKLELKDDITLDHILQFKDLFQPVEENFEDETLLKNILYTINVSLDELLEMRKNEAENILKDINQRLEHIGGNTAKIFKLAKNNPTQEYEKLVERVQGILNGKSIDENRLEMELALIADRVDITEECTRLKSHIHQFNEILENKQEVGKLLTFILQEMHREINTIGSKTTNIEISHLAINIKEEIEKLREQIQNLE